MRDTAKHMNIRDITRNTSHAAGAPGFLHVTLFIICSLFLLVVGVHQIGKRIPVDTVEILDPDGGKYEEAGIARDYDSYRVDEADAQARARQQALDTLYRGVDVRTVPDPVPPQPRSPQPASDDVADSRVSAQDSEIGLDQAETPRQSQLSSQANLFTSKINERISFRYPAGAKVTEKNMSASAESHAIAFTIVDSEKRAISVEYDKVAGGCFDPIRSFAISPDTVIDYRILAPTRSISVEGKHSGERTDEEIGSYVFAGLDPARPFIYASNVCIQSAVPTRLRLSSTQFKAGERDALASMYDLILSEITI